MTYEEYNAFCCALPATSHVVQWGGSHAWKGAAIAERHRHRRLDMEMQATLWRDHLRPRTQSSDQTPAGPRAGDSAGMAHRIAADRYRRERPRRRLCARGE